MGVLAPVSAHAGPFDQPPIGTSGIFRHMFLQRMHSDQTKMLIRKCFESPQRDGAKNICQCKAQRDTRSKYPNQHEWKTSQKLKITTTRIKHLSEKPREISIRPSAFYLEDK